jgi:anhydro-N-acetylmuramic acid kinase
MRIAGIMSGTSLDGVDVAIVDIAKSGKFRIVATRHTAYPAKVKAAILGVSNTQTHTAAISRLNFQLGEIYAAQVIATCKSAGIPLASLDWIGCHGQTIFHEGRSNTLQIGEAAVIAERTGVGVVSNFRERDIAAGGQGAPLVPLFDYMLFRHPTRGRIALNLGGIANITAIPAKAGLDDIIAFDTGPANMIIDQLMVRMSGGKSGFDRNGSVARRGTVHRALLRDLLSAPYFKRKPPKSAGREQYGAEYVERLIASGIAIEDLIATAAWFTAESVSLGMAQVKGSYHDLIVGGGGARNSFLMELLGKTTGLRVSTTADFGVDADFKEAAAFALLAWHTVRRKPGNVRSATGARRAVILGKLTHA